MRILFTIHHELDPNAGAPGATLALGQALEQRGNQVTYVSFDDLPRWVPPLAREALFPEFAARIIAQRTRSWAPDVIDSSTGDAWVWASLPRRRRPRLVTRSHGLEHAFWAAARSGSPQSIQARLYHGGFRLREVARSLRLADAAIFLNSADRDYAVQQLRVRADHAHVLPNGIPATYLRRPTPVPGPADGLAFVGSWSDRKGRAVLRTALGSLLPRHPHLRVSLLGTRLEPRRVLEDFEPSLHRQLHVVPHFPHAALPEHLAHHQIFVLPSFSEGFPLSLLEAMACGLAPVVSDLAVMRDQLRHRENALLVRPGDALGLEQALETMLTQDSFRDHARRQAYERAQAFGWDSVATATSALYDRLLDRAQREIG